MISQEIVGQVERELNWQIIHPLNQQLIAAGTHGSVQEALIRSGELPDPFYGLNEEKFAWVEDYEWTFISQFQLSQEDLSNEYLELEFPGIDVYASIYLNDSLLFKAENCFKPYRAQVKDFVKLGTNKLKVIFTPPVMYHAERYKNEKFHYPAVNDVHKVAIASYTRKPQFQFGWDWALRMNTIGFLKPVVLHSFNINRLLGKNCTTRSIDQELATLDFQAFFTNTVSDTLVWKSKLFGDVVVQASTSKCIERRVVVEQPRLWWPRGQGSQDMYQDTWRFENQQGELIDSMQVRFGIRLSELVIEPDQWGTSYFVKINNRPVFCKGADYIPQDIFPARVKEEAIVEMVDQMVASNFNMVRVWGGGYYPDEVFFDACDEQGIMVWQDLMFACAMYPGDSLMLNNLRGEFEYQIPRIASHPSLVLFNGNNEVDVAWKNWGLQLKYSLYGKDAQQIEEDYKKIFKILAPEVISKYTNSPYVHTSPLSNWGKDEYFNHATMHYWGVWHGKDPIEDFGRKTGRFNAEYGFQSFPEYSTLNRFSTRDDWELESKVMKHHQKSYVGNGMILKHAQNLYGKPENFEEFVYYSQLTQAKAIDIAIAGHRIGMPRCMGTLYWQMNDCWPAPTWSSIDYYGNWKALQYVVRKDYEDVALVAKVQELGKEEYFIVSDSPEAFSCKLNWKAYNLQGKEIASSSQVLDLKQGAVVAINDTCFVQQKEDKNYVLHFTWHDAKGKLKERWFSHIAKEIKKTETKEVAFSIIQIDSLAKTGVIAIENESFIRDCWISSNSPGLYFDLNFEDYLPGRHLISFRFNDRLPVKDDFILKWR